jgi:hypothetical protein
MRYHLLRLFNNPFLLTGASLLTSKRPSKVFEDLVIERNDESDDGAGDSFMWRSWTSTMVRTRRIVTPRSPLFQD